MNPVACGLSAIAELLVFVMRQSMTNCRSYYQQQQFFAGQHKILRHLSWNVSPLWRSLRIQQETKLPVQVDICTSRHIRVQDLYYSLGFFFVCVCCIASVICLVAMNEIPQWCMVNMPYSAIDLGARAEATKVQPKNVWAEAEFQLSRSRKMFEPAEPSRAGKILTS